MHVNSLWCSGNDLEQRIGQSQKIKATVQYLLAVVISTHFFFSNILVILAFPFLPVPFSVSFKSSVFYY